ncbi:hypothetical protein ACFRIC_30645 [Streptomyces sp. NPDC056738]|uniref:hypothetical protein n=1 Tax=Streptomyces sp. NPDC056738 TaxID=3345933 RepID=UPI0036B18E90
MTFEPSGGFTTSGVWYAAVQEAQAKLHREDPGAWIDVKAIGHAAWRELTPVEQAHALDDLFVAYVLRVNDEQRAARLDQAAAEVKTYLVGDDEHILQDQLGTVDRPIAEDTEVKVCASALANVLDELDLIRHRLSMRDREGEKQ